MRESFVLAAISQVNACQSLIKHLGKGGQMEKQLKFAFEAEMAAAYRLIAAGRLERAFRHLERAHVLGQRHVLPHVRSHWAMLKIGLRRRSSEEILGQTIRIVLGALGSAVNVVPVGNTGGTNISMFARLPIEKDLARSIRRAGKSS